MWNFCNCTGALDRKNVKIAAPAKRGSLYFNYKGYHSSVLMTIIDTEHKFILWMLVNQLEHLMEVFLHLSGTTPISTRDTNYKPRNPECQWGSRSPET